MAGVLLVAALAAACEADAHDDLVQKASKLPPQDTLAGAYAPAPSTGTGGSATTPPAAGAPAGADAPSGADAKAAGSRPPVAPAGTAPAGGAPAAGSKPAPGAGGH
jgi:hypothetical protein